MKLLDRPQRLGAGLLRTAARTTVSAALPLLPRGGHDELDPQLRRVATVFAAMRQDTLPIPLLRAAYRVDAEIWQGSVPYDVRTTDEQLTLPLDPSGPRRTVRVRTYEPPQGGDAAMVYLHGGGFTIGSIETHDAMCRRLAAGAGVTIQSVEYRLAPEHPFPAGLTDACAAFAQLQRRWVAAGGDADRFGVGGDSAGGQAGAVVADEAVEPTLGVEVPMPGFCWLVYPATETHRHGGFADVLPRGGLMSGPMVVRFAEQHVPSAADRTVPALNPGLRSDDVLAAHPRTWIQTVGFDPLREEGERYAARLAALGVDVTHDHAPTMAHAYISMTGVSPGAARAVERSAQALRAIAHA